MLKTKGFEAGRTICDHRHVRLTKPDSQTITKTNSEFFFASWLVITMRFDSADERDQNADDMFN